MDKTCFKCRTEKPLSEFYKHEAMTDGYLGKCKECTKADVRQHRQKNIEKVRAKDRLKGRTAAHRARCKEYRSRPENKGRWNKNRRAWQDRNKDKRACHVIANNAMRSGRLVRQPCEICGEAKVDAHHDDYAYPLDVRWLCRTHHMELHRKYKD